MSSLRGTVTEQNLNNAFAWESRANPRYLYFAQEADAEGFKDVAAVFRATAESKTGHAHRHLEYLKDKEVRRPATGAQRRESREAPVARRGATGQPIGPTRENLKAAISGETHEYVDLYPGMARAAREEGFDEIADWFETLAKAGKSHAGRLQKALDAL